MSRRILNWILAGLLGAASVSAQEPVSPSSGEQPEERPAPVGQATAALPAVPDPEPINPREALFLAIELRDEEAARRALRQGAEPEISLGDPSPLATAALHDDLRMVRLLISYGGNPGTTEDSPLEEAIRNENELIAALFLRSGASVPVGLQGEEMFRLAQRGSKYRELSKVLLDNGGNPDLCLAAATRHSRIEAIKYCLSRGGNVANLPAELNLLSVALVSEDSGFIESVVEQGLADRVFAGAIDEAIAAGELDLVRRAVTSGARLGFSQIESAVESGHPEICMLLLDQTPPDDPSVLAGGDVEELVQRAEDLGFDELSEILRRKSGRLSWTTGTILLGVIGVVLTLALLVFLIKNFRRQAVKVSVPANLSPTAPRRAKPSSTVDDRPIRSSAPDDRAVATPPTSPAPAATAQPAPSVAFQPPRPTSIEPVAPSPVQPTLVQPAPVQPVPVQPAPVQPSPVQPAPVQPAPVQPAPVQPAPVQPAPVQPAQVQPALAQPIPEAIPAPAIGESWQVAPEPVPLAPPARKAAATLVAQPQEVATFEIRMPEVDLSRRADAVFQAARQAAAGAPQPGVSEQRQVVLVTPARVTMLYPCPAPDSVAPQELAAAEELVPPETPQNIAVIAFNDLQALHGGIIEAMPFFGLLRQLGYLGHAVWIFEGHVSAMTPGCQDADLLIVDDGMMRHLPGNWRSVATRVMRGADIYAFERKAGTLRRLT